MINNYQEVEFPAICKISFHKVLDSIEAQAKDKDKNVAQYAKRLLKEVEPYPELREGFTDPKLLNKYRAPIEKLLRPLFPDALLMNEIKGVSAPFDFRPFFTSVRFANILKNAGKEFSFDLKKMDNEKLYIIGCIAIMQIYYHYPVDLKTPFIIDIPNTKTNTLNSYRIAMNGDLMEMTPTDKAIEITEDDYHELIDNFDNIDIWKKKFPPGSWIMKGIGVTNLMDVTLDQTFGKINSNLIVKSADTASKIQDNLRDLFKIKDLEANFVAFEDDKFKLIPKPGMNGYILNGKPEAAPDEALCDYTKHQLFEKKETLVISDVIKFDSVSQSELSKALKKQKINSYLLTPIVHNDTFLGFLELASPRKYELNSISASKLSEVLPIIAMAANRFREDDMNKIEAIIQQECTTIHPSVKWKFEEVAQQYLLDQQQGKDVHFDDIIFNDIYPLYGQLDIKGSSTQRNEAVKKDLITQLRAVKKILSKAFKKTSMPAYEELIFRIDTYKNEIENGLLAGSEHKITDFLQADIYPVFKHIKQSDKQLAKLVEQYKTRLDSKLMIYDARRNFDESVTLTNKTLAAFIDGKQEEAQRIFPHYFERYKTDGVEYNIYIGQSIVKNETFDPIHLSNMRIWQLIVMCEMERKFHELQPELKEPLEIASLILAYSTSLSVHFRTDEKQFDVDGAYNARYEIVKKRVDKAHIKNTKERITQPGKLAIIYSSDQDAWEYKKYLKFLRAKGYLANDKIEDLELENLQGITGLKALRVKVAYPNENEKFEEISTDKIMEALKMES